MTATQPPLYLGSPVSHPADSFRRLIEALAPAPGIVGSGHLAVSALGTPNMSVNVAAGEAIVPGTESAVAQGSYHVVNDATVNLTIAASNPTNPRNDLIVARVRDADYSGADRDWLLAVITGTPAASPADPTPPANSVTLARVRVDAAATSIVAGKITDLRPYASGLRASWPSEAVRYVPGAGKTTASTSYVDVDGSTAQITDFTKRDDKSDLELLVACEAFVTGATAIIDMAVRINGTDYDVARHSYQALSTYQHVGGTVDVASLPAGTYDCRLRWKVSTGSSTATIDGGGQISFRVKEKP